MQVSFTRVRDSNVAINPSDDRSSLASLKASDRMRSKRRVPFRALLRASGIMSRSFSARQVGLLRFKALRFSVQHLHLLSSVKQPDCRPSQAMPAPSSHPRFGQPHRRNFPGTVGGAPWQHATITVGWSKVRPVLRLQNSIQPHSIPLRTCVQRFKALRDMGRDGTGVLAFHFKIEIFHFGAGNAKRPGSRFVLLPRPAPKSSEDFLQLARKGWRDNSLCLGPEPRRWAGCWRYGTTSVVAPASC